MARFINRFKELEFLESEYKKSGSSLIILYGRRRIGKDKNMLYFFATEESEIQNRNQFKDLVANYIRNELLKNATVDNWDIIFDTLLNSPTEQKKLIILYEF